MATLEADPLLIAARLLRPTAPESPWRLEARPEQLPPDGSWFIWLVLAGRAWGKTRAGAAWLAEKALSAADHYAVIGRSESDTRETCVEGPSGLLRALGLTRSSPEYRRGTGEIRLANGSVIHSYSAESPESTRGPNLSAVWADELAAWRFVAETWTETILLSVRIGDAQIAITTTPRGEVPLLRDLLSRDDRSVAVTLGTTWDNEANLSKRALEEFRRFEHTRIGRQELYGELLDDVEGALWTRELIEPYRVTKVERSELVRVVVGVDPAVTAHAKSNETGIVVCGLDGDGHAYVLDDLTCKLAPDAWARRVANAYEKWQADRIVCEQTHGFSLLESVMRTVDNSLPISLVNAHAGKSARAEPTCASYEQGKIHHVGSLPELEDQMCTWVPMQGPSPDRVDALVWCLDELKPGRVAGTSAPRVIHHESRWTVLGESAGG